MPMLRQIFCACLALLLLASCVGRPGPELPEVSPLLRSVAWQQLEGWSEPSVLPALAAFRHSCRAIGKRPVWRRVCTLATAVAEEEAAARQFFETFFEPYQVLDRSGDPNGLITGYYGPELEGRRIPDEDYRYPLYQQPDDLLIVDLDEIYPELEEYRLRGRLVGNRVVPYFERSEIDGGQSSLAGHELFWVKDPVELFFLHIQGSGRIRLPDGERVMVNYANQNGFPYRSIGRLLLARGAMTRDQMSMQNIRRWVAENPDAGRQLLAENPSYIFFRELPPDYQSPPGALGVPLTAGHSLAVDPRSIPLGAPVFLATIYPGTGQDLRRLMVAQDTGGAIKGRVRADFFWGMGNAAGDIAGRMKEQGRLWVLLPTDRAAEIVTRMEKRQPGRLAETVN